MDRSDSRKVSPDGRENNRYGSYARRSTRVWPTLLSAAAQAAIRARLKKSVRTADVHTAVIMSRTAFDAYIHEMFSLRDLPPYVRFARGHNSRKRLSKTRWRLIDHSRKSLSGLRGEEKTNYDDARELNLTEKLQTLMLLIVANRDDALIADFEIRFGSIFSLNALRNAIVHHDFQPPSGALLDTCSEIRRAVGLASQRTRGAWEDILLEAPVAEWACLTIARSIIEIEMIETSRTIHFGATRDAVVSAIAPLKI